MAWSSVDILLGMRSKVSELQCFVLMKPWDVMYNYRSSTEIPAEVLVWGVHVIH